MSEYVLQDKSTYGWANDWYDCHPAFETEAAAVDYHRRYYPTEEMRLVERVTKIHVVKIMQLPAVGV